MSGKNIRNIIDCHLKKKYSILIIFGTNISGTTGHEMTVPYPTSFSVCFFSTRKQQNQRNISWNEQKFIKKHSQHYQLWLEEDYDNFWCKHFWHYLPLDNCPSFYLTKCLLLHYLEKPVKVKYDKNAIFCWIFFSQVVQKQKMGAVENRTVIWWPVVSEILMSKII